MVHHLVLHNDRRHGFDLTLRSAAPGHEEDQADDQDNSDDPDTTLRSPVVVGVVTTAPPNNSKITTISRIRFMIALLPCSKSLRSAPSLSLLLLDLPLVLEDLAQGFFGT